MNTLMLPWKALLLAPLASVPAITLAGLGSSDAGIASDIGWGLFFGVVLGIPVSYLGMALVGLPAFLVLRRFNLLRLWILCPLGCVCALPLFYDAPLRTTLMAVAVGAAVSISAYFLLPRTAPHRTGIAHQNC